MNMEIEFLDKYGKWLDKKLKGKPEPVQTLQRRTINTAATILSTIKDVPFADLSYELFFLCKDMETAFFPRQYEAQLELAGADPDKFAKGLHKFYNDMARIIKERDLYQAFFEVMAACSKIRCNRFGGSKERNSIPDKVIDCYQSLLLQQTEYIRPEKFNFSVVVCGRATTGELLTVPDTFPNFDAPALELELMARAGMPMGRSEAEFDALVARTYAKYGFTQVKGIADVERITHTDRVFTHHQCAMLPYINEYTYDIVPDPKRAFTTLTLPLYMLQYSNALQIDSLREKLRRRSRTLPTNGVVINLRSKDLTPPDAQILRSLKMKELLYGDSIIMLYKLDTISGELCGYYDTQEGFFFSVLAEASDRTLHERLALFVLYLYATQVTRDGANLQASLGENFWYAYDGETYRTREGCPCVDIAMQPYGRGGKLENTYVSRKTGARSGSDAYESEQKNIQGYIRRLPDGHTASEEAVRRAEALGYDLAANETYVQPFIKKVLKLKPR